MQNYWNLERLWKRRQLTGPVNYRDFRETGPWISTYRGPANMGEEKMTEWHVWLHSSNKTMSKLFFHRSSMLMAVSAKKIVEFQKFCYHGNVTSHFSSLLRLRIPCQGNSYVYCIMISGQNVLSWPMIFQKIYNSLRKVLGIWDLKTPKNQAIKWNQNHLSLKKN